MMKIRTQFCALSAALWFCTMTTTIAQNMAPAPCGPAPSDRQMKWHDMEFYAFVHFTTTTFRDIEWGYGDADPDEFCPTDMDCDEWARTIKEAGMKGVVLTAKHHDGFCLWPSKLTDYSVASSKWMNGKGDVVGALAKAARKHGLKFGVYLSPWDRHDLRYGTPEYLDYYRGQLRELLTQYGPIFEVWQDGANGGDGYYGGKREKRRIDNRTYYDWPTTNAMIRELQPEACIFSDGGPDVRWCGTETGYMNDTNWSMITRKNYAPGHASNNGLRHGEKYGTDWVPAEADVSVRPGWFYHEREDSLVKSPEKLMDIYYCSVGRNANLILNIPIAKNGRVHPIDKRNLREFGRRLKQEFSRPLSRQVKRVVATSTRGDAFSARKVIDGKNNTYWAACDGDTTATLTLDFKAPTKMNRMMLSEEIRLGQRVSAFTVEAETADNRRITLATATTIGRKRLLRFPTQSVRRLHINITGAKACPTLSRVECYLAD